MASVDELLRERVIELDLESSRAWDDGKKVLALVLNSKAQGMLEAVMIMRQET